MTNCGSLLNYIQAAWGGAVTPGVAAIHWNEDWYNARYPNMPQITVSELTNEVLERYTTGGSMDMRTRPLMRVNCWYPVPRGDVGTAHAQAIENMRKEVAAILMYGWGKNNYGGSLSPLRLALPRDSGMALHELDKVPRMLRYELTIIATEDI